jgi:hypothetical protein
MACPEDHLEYASETLAANAYVLHHWVNPSCQAFAWFPCGDHWHVGHPDRVLGEQCKAKGAGKPVRT